MPEMRPNDQDDPGRLTVILLHGFAVQTRLNGSRYQRIRDLVIIALYKSTLYLTLPYLGVDTFGNSKEHCIIDGSPDFPHGFDAAVA